ncbi:MAG: hypothetical protein EAZ08_01770 [Cytophagales bacterium]|nr:MAG: hypothetical protein EAZ08_01770 [Cytophagales bacterium]
MERIILVFLLFSISVNISAQSDKDLIIKLTDEQETINIGLLVSYLEDVQGALTIGQINTPSYQKLFVKSEMPVLNFGLSSDSFYWVKIQIKNQTPEKNWVLELPYPMFEFADWYTDISGSWTLQKDGFGVPQAQRAMQSRYPALPLSLAQHQTQTVYLRFKANTLACPLHIQSAKTYRAQHRFRDISFGAIQGIIALVLSICLYLYISYKRVSYLVFSLAVTSIFVFSFFYDGYWRAGLANQQSQVNFIFFSLYAVVFFNINNISRPIFAFSKGLLAYLLVSYVLSWFVASNTAAIWGQINYAIMLCFILTVSIKALRRGNQEAKLYLAGMAAQFIFISIEIALVNLGKNRPFINFMHVGFFSEIVIFAFALAKQASTEQKELEKAKITAQNEVIAQAQENERIVKEQNNLLEQRVQERTNDLIKANEDIYFKNEALQTTEEELRQNMEELAANQEELKAQKESIEAAFQLLQIQNTKVNDSIRYAQRIQNAILPDENVLAAAFAEYFVLFKPKDVVSGDFYWYAEIENRKFIAVVDCTGHGVPGAFMSMIGNTLLYEIINTKRIFEPNLILENLHSGILNSLNKKEAKMQDGMDIALCCLEKQESNKVKVLFSGAKRPLFYFSANQLTEIQADRKSIGHKNSASVNYTLNEIILKKGDTLYMATDGWIDAINPERVRFGSQKFKEMLLKGANLPLKAQEEVFRYILEDYEQGTEQRDDILLVGVRV